MANDQPYPASYDLVLYRGDSRRWQDTIEKNTGTDTAPVWVPVDLTGYTFLSQIRDSRETTATLLAPITVTVLDAVHGLIQMDLAHSDAKAMPLLTRDEPGWWDLQLTAPDGFVRTHVAGKVRNDGDASHE